MRTEFIPALEGMNYATPLFYVGGGFPDEGCEERFAHSAALHLKNRSVPKASLLAEIAMIYIAPGDTDQAIVWLEKRFVQERSNGHVSMRNAPIRASRSLPGASGFDKTAVPPARTLIRSDGINRERLSLEK